MTKLEAEKTRLQCHIADLQAEHLAKVQDLEKEIDKTKGELDKEKLQIEKWHCEVTLAINQLEHLMLMCDEHNKVCKSFTSQLDAYYEEYEAFGEEDEAS